ncbi:mating locus protein, putative [Trichophyton verrucosum HKI 0517]|uniref:Mating locus protein, putative n=1 Tax=Trichophyton verrucosum (strain HKI 0517) TaxID=663202 RepID=D4D4N6_TRIVH|nr:mating locus protein, putative [Trichophyton verrucosum HKI 0517]EFE43238.1 mating locus protein, putative [Trichophyton verrucosum HKI 0517]
MDTFEAYETNNRGMHNEFARYLGCNPSEPESPMSNTSMEGVTFGNGGNDQEDSFGHTHFEVLNRLIELYRVQPDASDFTGKLLKFSDKLEIPELNGEILGENGQSKDRHREIFKAHARLFEDEANYRLFQHVQEHGPASIYWRAFREYFTGEIINMVESHWRPDPRCAQVRIDAHSLSYQAINEVPFMSTAERNLVIRATGSYPEDAMSFFTWMTRNRLTYLMVKEMSDLFFFRIRTLAGHEIDLNMEREMARMVNWAEHQ